ncbi:hypothetical protein, partial [Hallella sp.]|uniref:hypothetical protein n=1 Tax=Hallella sp. TaxID=2980186 RepID=UPI00307BBA0F
LYKHVLLFGVALRNKSLPYALSRQSQCECHVALQYQQIQNDIQEKQFKCRGRRQNKQIEKQ